jgi:hypothetical protein
MLDDNLVYSLSKDNEDKDLIVVMNEYNGSLRRKLDAKGIKYRMEYWKTISSKQAQIDKDRFTIIAYCISLGLHSTPAKLKTTVEELTAEIQPYVDAVGFYLGTCGNYDWDIPKWCAGMGYKPSAMFCDHNGELCHDRVGLNIAGGPRYLEMQKKYPGHFYLFPAMAANYDDFMNADQADALATEASLTGEMREELGIEPGRDGYMRWLFRIGGYEYILKLDTNLMDEEEFDRDIAKIADRTHLKVKDAEPGWATLQPTDEMYERCKSLLPQ